MRKYQSIRADELDTGVEREREREREKNMFITVAKIGK